MPRVITDSPVKAGKAAAATETAEAAKAPATNKENEGNTWSTDTPQMESIRKLTIEFKSDLHKSSPLSSGILHATTTTSTKREEHVFAWLASTTHYAAAVEYLSQFGFTDNIVFIPFSSKRAWMERYPLAMPHINIDADGKCAGFPYWHPATTAPENSGGTHPHIDGSSKTTPKKRGRPKLKKKLFPSATLSHIERELLHIQIYKYFTWLHSQLNILEGESNGKRLMSRAGLSCEGVQSVMDELEGLRAIGKIKDEEEEELGTDLPFLEEGLVSQLEKMAEEETASGKATDGDGAVKKQRRSKVAELDFDDMFGRLIHFRDIHGHVNVSHKYKDDLQLAQWVSNLRQKKKAYIQKQQEDEDQQLAETDGETPKAERRGRRQYLDEEKINKLDSVGFTWSFERQGKTWEERFQDLMTFKAEHGHCRVPRKEGGLGEWVHVQRRKYKAKNKNFMKYHAKVLQDVGFDFRARNVEVVTWDTGFQELIAFGRLNGHYNIPCPLPPHMEAAGYDGDDENVASAYRLYKWVNRIINEYPTYASGKYSRLLNEERVRQLNSIGFEFN